VSKILILGMQKEIVITTSEIKYVKVITGDDKFTECPKSEAIGMLDVPGNCVYPMEFTTVTVESIPIDIELNNKYCYEVSKGFYKNPNYKEPPKSLEELTQAYDIVTEHQAEVEIDVDFRLCMLELGLV